MKFTESVRALIKLRANNRCELCGSRLLGGHIHHRQPRGMGGSRTVESKGSAANGLWIHPGCHMTIELSRARALDKGWLIKQGQDPASTPVRLWDGWWLLADDGTMARVDGPTREVSGP